MNVTGGGAPAGLVLVGALGFALLCLSRAVRHSDGFYDALVRHVEAQRQLNRVPAAPAASYWRDRHAVAAALQLAGWTVFGLGLVPLLPRLLAP